MIRSTVLILLFRVIVVAGAEQHCDSKQFTATDASIAASGSMMLQVKTVDPIRQVDEKVPQGGLVADTKVMKSMEEMEEELAKEKSRRFYEAKPQKVLEADEDLRREGAGAAVKGMKTMQEMEMETAKATSRRLDKARQQGTVDSSGEADKELPKASLGAATTMMNSTENANSEGNADKELPEASLGAAATAKMNSTENAKKGVASQKAARSDKAKPNGTVGIASTKMKMLRSASKARHKVTSGEKTMQLNRTSNRTINRARNLASSRTSRGRGERKRGRRGLAGKDSLKSISCVGGRIDNGKCWYVAIPATSCEETCAEANLQYDDATDLGPIENATHACLRIARKLGFQGKRDKILDNSWSGQGCGCTVFKVPAYGKGDAVRLKRGSTNAKCAKTSTIASRVCACKARSPIGAKCDTSSECLKGYCVGTCIKLAAKGQACSEHSACQTEYCDSNSKKCAILKWTTKNGAFAMSYRRPGAKRATALRMPAGVTWEAASKFPKGFCLGYYPRTTGCLVARGIRRQLTIAIAKARCAQSAECRSVWCCATGCPATTCYATRVEWPNHLRRDCPTAPGSFGETRYPNTMYVKHDAYSSLVRPAPLPALAPSAPKPLQEANFKLMQKGAICRTGRKSVRGRKVSVSACSEAVRQEKGAAFLYLARKQICFHAPKFEDCKALKRSRFDYYNLLLDVDDEMPEDE